MMEELVVDVIVLRLYLVYAGDIGLVCNCGCWGCMIICTYGGCMYIMFTRLYRISDMYGCIG